MTALLTYVAGVAALAVAGCVPLVRGRSRAAVLERIGVLGARRRPAKPWRATLACSLGRRIRSLARLPADRDADRFVGRVAVVATAVAIVVSPVLAGVVIWGCAGWRLWARHARVSRRERSGVENLPDLIDLLRVAVSAGCTASDAVRAVAGNAPEPLRPALQETLDAHRRGASLTDALQQLPPALGDAARPLVAALARALGDGTPVLRTLERLSLEARRNRRRQVEVRARRLPVLLLFPLVVCTLPAFALLTVVPLLLTSLQHLRL